MGTRHLIAVIKDGQPKIAQYGQWDGYPSGQGAAALGFLHSLLNSTVPGGLERFAQAVDRCRFAATDAELERLWNNAGYRARYLTRDLGAEILDSVFNAEGEVVLRNSYSFGGEGLFCEYAYVIDLDARTFEIYEGFKEADPPDGERCAGMRKAGEDYGPVHHVKTYSLDALPSVDAFLADLTPSDEEEEAA